MVNRTTTGDLSVSDVSPTIIADEWRRLLGDCVPAYPFQHPAWHDVWWRCFGGERRPRLFAVRVNDRLVAIAPLMHDGDRLLFAGDPNICDYMDLIVAPDAPAATYDALLTEVARAPWRELVLWGIPATSPTLRELPALARERGWSAEEEFEAVCPRVALPVSWDLYLASLSKKDRHELRRKMRRFAESGAGMTLVTLTAPDDVRAGLDEFIRLHSISRHDKRDFMTPTMEGFFRAMAGSLAEHDLVRLFFVQLDGRSVAGLLAFDTGDDLLLYNSGYDPAFSHASVGLVSKALALQAAVENGKRTYDFLRGAEPYKYDLGATDREVHTLTLIRAE